MNISIRNQSCPNKNCFFYEMEEEGNIKIHSQKKQRLACKNCGKTWVMHKQKIHYRLRSKPAVIQRAMSMLEQEIPIRRVAKSLNLDPSTIQRWKNRKQKQKRSIYFN